MKIQATLDIEDIKPQLKNEDAYELMSCFEDNIIMDALERIDYDRSEWIILDRMIMLIEKLSMEFESEIKDAVVNGYISEETSKFLYKYMYKKQNNIDILC